LCTVSSLRQALERAANLAASGGRRCHLSNARRQHRHIRGSGRAVAKDVRKPRDPVPNPSNSRRRKERWSLASPLCSAPCRKAITGLRMGKHTVAASLGITYCVVTVAWCFALVKMVVWLGTGIPALAHSLSEQAGIVISGHPVLASPPAASSTARPQSKDCDPLEPTRCVLLPIHGDRPSFQSPL
jgi:hypothetical protein